MKDSSIKIERFAGVCLGLRDQKDQAAARPGGMRKECPEKEKQHVQSPRGSQKLSEFRQLKERMCKEYGGSRSVIIQ